MSHRDAGAGVDRAPRGDAPRAGRVSLAEASKVWAQIGLLSFGGPAGQIALMHRVLVEERRWISEVQFLHALNFCMLLPGPEAQQLATYVGWLLHRIRGGLIAGTLFILPGALVILGLSYLYATAGDLPWVQGLFHGLKPAVIVIVLQAVVRIGRRSLRSALLGGLAAAAFIAMFLFRVPFPIVILAAVLAGSAAAYQRGSSSPADPLDDEDLPGGNTGYGYALRCLMVGGILWLAPTLVLTLALGPDHVFAHIGAFFSKMAVVTFGGAYAVLAYVSQEAVQHFGWLQPGEMIDGLALAETTPGPLILVAQFVGFLAAYRAPGSLDPALAGLFGGMLTLWVTFVPCFLWIFLGAPHMEKLRHNRLLSGALAGVTAAVVGVVANLAVWFAIHALFTELSTWSVAGTTLEVPVLASARVSTMWLALIAALLVFRLRASVLITLVVTSVIGVAIHVL